LNGGPLEAIDCIAVAITKPSLWLLIRNTN
jgi:hypothetical protein